MSSGSIAQRLADIASVVAFTGVALYLLLAFATYLFPIFPEFKAVLRENEVLALGVPSIGVGAFCVVVLLLQLFPAHKDNGVLKIKVFGAEFTGPAAPIMFWVVCFLALIVAVKWLRINAG